MFKFEKLGTDGGYSGYRKDDKGQEIPTFHKSWAEKLNELEFNMERDNPGHWEIFHMFTRQDGPHCILIVVLKEKNRGRSATPQSRNHPYR